MAKGRQIKTPRGTLYERRFKDGRVSCALRWNPGFGPDRTRRFASVQQFVDSEVLRRCGPYVPMLSGMLLRSGELGTVIGSGEVRYVAPYARRLYYGIHFRFDKTAHPDAGALWFERMKASHKGDILRGAARLAGGAAHG